MPGIPKISDRFSVSVPQVFMPQPSGRAAAMLQGSLRETASTLSELAVYIARSKENSQVNQGEIALLQGSQNILSGIEDSRDYDNALDILGSEFDSLSESVLDSVSSPRARDRLKLTIAKQRLAARSTVRDFALKGQADLERTAIGEWSAEALKAYYASSAAQRELLVKGAEEKYASAVQSGALSAEVASTKLAEFKAAATMAAISEAMRGSTAQAAMLELKAGEQWLTPEQVSAASAQIERLEKIQQEEMVQSAGQEAKDKLRSMLTTNVRNWPAIQASVDAMASEIASIAPDVIDAEDAAFGMLRNELTLAVDTQDVDAFNNIYRMVPNTVEAQSFAAQSAQRLADRMGSTIDKADRIARAEQVFSDHILSDSADPEYQKDVETHYLERFVPDVSVDENGSPRPPDQVALLDADYAQRMRVIPKAMRSKWRSAIAGYDPNEYGKDGGASEDRMMIAMQSMAKLYENSPGIFNGFMNPVEEAMVRSFQVAGQSRDTLRQIVNTYKNMGEADLQALRKEYYETLKLDEKIRDEFGDIVDFKFISAMQEIGWLHYADGLRNPDAVIDVVKRHAERVGGEYNGQWMLFPPDKWFSPPDRGNTGSIIGALLPLKGKDRRPSSWTEGLLELQVPSLQKALDVRQMRSDDWLSEDIASSIVGYARAVVDQADDPITKARWSLVLDRVHEIEGKWEAFEPTGDPEWAKLQKTRAVMLDVFDVLKDEFGLDVLSTPDSWSRYAQHDGGTVGFEPRYNLWLMIDGVRVPVEHLTPNEQGRIMGFVPNFSDSLEGRLYNQYKQDQTRPARIARHLQEISEHYRILRKPGSPTPADVAERYLTAEQMRALDRFESSQSSGVGEATPIPSERLMPQLPPVGMTLLGDFLPNPPAVSE